MTNPQRVKLTGLPKIYHENSISAGVFVVKFTMFDKEIIRTCVSFLFEQERGLIEEVTERLSFDYDFIKPEDVKIFKVFQITGGLTDSDKVLQYADDLESKINQNIESFLKNNQDSEKVEVIDVKSHN